MNMQKNPQKDAYMHEMKYIFCLFGVSRRRAALLPKREAKTAATGAAVRKGNYPAELRRNSETAISPMAQSFRGPRRS